MLLVSAILVSTATYAWFTMNASVTASNMAIKATTQGSLLISKDDVSWTTATSRIDFELDTSSEAIDVTPVSVNPSAAGTTWYTASGTDANNGTRHGNFTALANSSFTTSSNAEWQSGSTTYALHETFYIKSPSGDMSKLGVSGISVSKLDGQTSNTDIDNAVTVRIEIRTKGSTDTIFTTWVNTSSTTISYATGTNSQANGFVLKSEGGNLVKNASDTATHTIDMTADTSYEVDVYIYIDGENANCTSYKAYGWKGVTLDITFGTDITYQDEA